MNQQKDLKGSKTQANLLTAFSGESQAYTKYGYYSSQAKKDGYEQIGALFTDVSNNEKEHAKIWFKLLHDNSIPSTPQNLADAAAGEQYEWSQMYAQFAIEAHEEGFERIALLFEGVAEVEKVHEACFRQLQDNISQGKVFSGDKQTVWVCRNCGHEHIGSEPPEVCPVCSHARAYFQRKAENY